MRTGLCPACMFHPQFYHMFKQFALAPKSSTIGTRLWHVFPGGFRWLFDVNMPGVVGFSTCPVAARFWQFLEAPVDQDRTGDGGRICDYMIRVGIELID